MTKQLKNIQNDSNYNKKEAKLTKGGMDFLLKMVISYTFFLLIILILFSCLHNATLKNAKIQYQQNIQSTLAGNAQIFEKDLDIINAYCFQLLQHQDFLKLTQMAADNTSFQMLGASLSAELAKDIYPRQLLPATDIFCYLGNSEYILAPNYFDVSEHYFHQAPYYMKDFFDQQLKALTFFDNYNCFIPLNQSFEESGGEYYIYVINLNDFYHTNTVDSNAKNTDAVNINAAVCILIKQETLVSYFHKPTDDMDYQYLSIFNQEGGCMLSISINGIYPAPSFAGSTKEDIVSYYKSLPISTEEYHSKNCTYYYGYPPFVKTSNIARQQILHLILFFAALSGLIIVFSRRNLRPFLKLGQELQEMQEEKNYLEQVIDSQRPILYNSYVRQLIKGTIAAKEEVEFAKKLLGLTQENLFYNSLYIIAYNNVNDEPNDTEPHTPTACNAAIMEALQTYLDKPLYFFSPSDRTYAVILVCCKEEADKLVEKTNETVLQLHNYLLDTYGIWIFAGIGRNTDDIMSVWESYQQAMEAINYTSKNHIIFPYDAIKKDSSSFYYPPELSTKLIHFVTTGNTSQVLELFNLLHQENIEERSLPINLLQFLLSDIRNTLIKARFALPSNTPAEETIILDKYFDQHVSFKLCEDIALRLCKLFTVETEDMNLVSTIEKYILENYMDPSMSLNKISDEFQISESYFSHMFKEKTGINFSNYLENIRMNEAARLIKESDISLNELYHTVGYNNASTFRRAFKKIYGVTPSAMRDTKDLSGNGLSI